MWYVFLENLFFIVVDFSCLYYLNLYIYIFFFNLVPCPIGFEFSIHQRLGAMCKPCPANMTTEKMGSTKPCMKCPPNSMTNELTICQCERFIIVLSQTYNIFMNFVFFSLFVISLMISTSKLLFLFIHVSIKKLCTCNNCVGLPVINVLLTFRLVWIWL